jgi:rare lipoprotein A
VASVYASKFQGRRTASGAPYNSQALTAAHPSLPFGSLVRVTSLTNGKTVVVRINDRGPFVEGRIIDLSRAAAQALRLRGLMQVEIEQLR